MHCREKKLAKISSGAVASAEAVLEKIDISKESEVGASDSKARTIPGPPTDLQTSKAVSLGKENSRLEEEAGHSQGMICRAAMLYRLLFPSSGIIG